MGLSMLVSMGLYGFFRCPGLGSFSEIEGWDRLLRFGSWGGLVNG